MYLTVWCGSSSRRNEHQIWEISVPKRVPFPGKKMDFRLDFGDTILASDSAYLLCRPQHLARLRRNAMGRYPALPRSILDTHCTFWQYAPSDRFFQTCYSFHQNHDPEVVKLKYFHRVIVIIWLMEMDSNYNIALNIFEINYSLIILSGKI